MFLNRSFHRHIYKFNYRLTLCNFLTDIKTNKFQYCSDVHVDTYKYFSDVPTIIPNAPNLLIAGDLGVPTHKNVYKFLKMTSNNFNMVYYTPGNHEYDCSVVFDERKYYRYKQQIRQLCNLFDNVILLDNNSYEHNDDIVIIGTTLWSKPLTIFTDEHKRHFNEHLEAVNFIEQSKKQFFNKKIILLTHFIPTKKLIEPKYLSRGENTTSFFATNLEHIITKPIVACVAGHSHSCLETTVNGIPCMLNAHGYQREQLTKIIKSKEFII